jgi:hypothetical protein
MFPLWEQDVQISNEIGACPVPKRSKDRSGRVGDKPRYITAYLELFGGGGDNYIALSISIL